MAEDILRDTQIPFQALLPLIDQTAAKIHTMRPAQAQTGPAQRGDINVQTHQLDVLNTSPRVPAQFSTAERTEVYRLLTALIAEHANE